VRSPIDNAGVTGPLRYDVEGLRAFAAACEQHALDVCAYDQPVLPATGYQSTVAAVSGLHSAAGSTGNVLSTRLRSTASAVSSAADRYSQTENSSADALNASMDTDMP
jgi:hypothetical protein